jgi:hypothetical protein
VDYFAQIVENPEGGTASLRGAELPTSGYFVGGIVFPLVLPGELGFAPAAEWYVEVFATYLTEHINADFLGWWTDSETGKVWVDGTTWHATGLEAGRVGRERGEIAIFDVAAQAEIRL